MFIPCSPKQRYALEDRLPMILPSISYQDMRFIIERAYAETLDKRDASILIEDVGIVASTHHYSEETRANALSQINQVVERLRNS